MYKEINFRNIGKNVRARRLNNIRRGKPLTQEQLAYNIEVTTQTVINLELSRVEPKLSILNKLAKFFNCRVEELFY